MYYTLNLNLETQTAVICNSTSWPILIRFSCTERNSIPHDILYEYHDILRNNIIQEQTVPLTKSMSQRTSQVPVNASACYSYIRYTAVYF